MNKTKIIVGAVVIAAVFFYGGYAFAGSRTPAQGGRTAFFANGSTTGGFRGMGGRQAGGLATGSIIGKDAQSITVQLQNGGSMIVFYSGSTQVAKTVAGSASDLAVGENVAVTGTQNSDGSLTAQMIQLRPARVATSTQAQ